MRIKKRKTDLTNEVWKINLEETFNQYIAVVEGFKKDKKNSS